jgi:hypothetical protein
MSKIIEGFFQTFDPLNRNGSRIYPESVFLNEIKKMRTKMRINKINKLFGNEE